MQISSSQSESNPKQIQNFFVGYSTVCKRGVARSRLTGLTLPCVEVQTDPEKSWHFCALQELPESELCDDRNHSVRHSNKVQTWCWLSGSETCITCRENVNVLGPPFVCWEMHKVVCCCLALINNHHNFTFRLTTKFIKWKFSTKKDAYKKTKNRTKNEANSTFFQIQLYSDNINCSRKCSNN